MTAPAAPPSTDWVPLLVPDMPSPQELLPLLERMHAARHYSNFGPLVKELEQALARKFGQTVNHVTTVANATVGLELVLHALGLPPGARVLIPAFTFVATATAVLRAGHVPVLADVDPCSWLLTPSIARVACERAHIDAALPVATFGMPHDMGAWQRFEQDTGVPVVIDAAAGFGSQWLNGAAGTIVFSMHTTKSLPAGEGGLVVSTRADLAERVRQLSNFGINLNAGANVPVGALASLGTNAKMSEYHAAIGLRSLQKWDRSAELRRALHADLIAEAERVCRHPLNWQGQGDGGPLMAPTLLCARLPDAASRSALEHECMRARITTRRWYQPLLNQMHILKEYCDALDTPNAEALSQTLLGLPFFLGMTDTQRQRMMAVMAY